MKYIKPEVIAVVYGTVVTHQVVCLRCDSTFFIESERSLFCEDCGKLPQQELSKYIDEQKHYSTVDGLCTVIGVKQAVPTTGKRSNANFTKALKRDGYVCRYCGYDPFNDNRIVSICVDHIIPHAYGGGNKLDNLVAACEECNLLVLDKVFSSFEEKRLFILEQRLKKGLPISEESLAFYKDYAY